MLIFLLIQYVWSLLRLKLNSSASIFYFWKFLSISSVAPPQGNWLRTDNWLTEEKEKGKAREKAHLPVGIEPGTSRSVVRSATTWATTTAHVKMLMMPGNSWISTSKLLHVGFNQPLINYDTSNACNKGLRGWCWFHWLSVTTSIFSSHW